MKILLEKRFNLNLSNDVEIIKISSLKDLEMYEHSDVDVICASNVKHRQGVIYYE